MRAQLEILLNLVVLIVFLIVIASKDPKFIIIIINFTAVYISIVRARTVPMCTRDDASSQTQFGSPR